MQRFCLSAMFAVCLQWSVTQCQYLMNLVGVFKCAGTGRIAIFPNAPWGWQPGIISQHLEEMWGQLDVGSFRPLLNLNEVMYCSPTSPTHVIPSHSMIVNEVCLCHIFLFSTVLLMCCWQLIVALLFDNSQMQSMSFCLLIAQNNLSTLSPATRPDNPLCTHSCSVREQIDAKTLWMSM